jgi:hypothetical protein
MVRNGDLLSSPLEHNGEETRRDSISSRGSWMKRLSSIPLSQSNSPRSSIGPDSPSLAFSHGSAAPILTNSGSSPAQQPPNKLVKRATSGRAASGSISRSASKPQVPTLRRPATSHQRTVNLQQQFREDSIKLADHSFETPSKQPLQESPKTKIITPTLQRSWRPYLESRPTKLTKERTSAKSTDGGLHNFHSTSGRVMPDETAKPVLVHPDMITLSTTSQTTYYDEDSLPFEEDVDEEEEVMNGTPLPPTEAMEPHKRARRSLSMHFSSPSSWISRSGSLRGNKRNPQGRSPGTRYSSAPVSSSVPRRRISTAHGQSSGHRAITDPTFFQNQAEIAENVPSKDPFAQSFRQRSRNSSSPLPPLSRLSSFNVDLARLGLSSSSSSAALQTHTTSTSVSTGHNSPISPLYFGSHNNKPDRASTLVGSDTDAKGFASGDEDDIDFQSETVFDSLRSGATGSIRSHNTQLDAMFDESPPNVSAKTKRLSIHELLANGVFREGNDRIVEEDEGMSTPVKAGRSSQDANQQTPVRQQTLDSDDFIKSSPPSFSLATKDFGRLSLDDEEDDEDWTRDDENPEINQLSPPSNSLRSRRVSPSLRAALADVTHSSTANGISASTLDRPKSNLFDWSEPSSAEKLDYLGNSPRPRTAHVKQATDGRGSRTIGRKGPSAMHIRSQSVPVVPDVGSQREPKLTPKFGTWGLGAKGVSEEWDGDFEFDNGLEEDDDGDSKMELSGMLVPLAIQASQESVVGHVGQIREVCLLVEDLKRLRLLAREKDLLGGSSASLWKEAEGIIALAVPDEEDPTLSPPHSPSSIIFSTEVVEDMFIDEGPDAEDIERPEAPFEVLNRHGRPTGFVYDGDTVRRRSVFSPDDDIFGNGAQVNKVAKDYLRPLSTSPRATSMKVSSEYARSVMETMHQRRSTSDPIITEMAVQTPNKMPFDTTSLRDLVHRASVLARTLADIIRKADYQQSPEVSPQRESSPAFTRVFTDPMASPPKQLGRSHSNNSLLSGSIDASPTRSLGQRMHMMTVV